MATTVVRPSDPAFRQAWQLAAVFGLLKLLVHVATNLWQVHLGYGYFRDELYYIECGRHLAWGFVDHGPVVAVQALVATTLFGKSLVAIRLLSALAGAVRVALTGLICWSLGGRRAAQGLAMVACLAAPMYLGLDSYLSMNSCESMFWMTAILALTLQLQPEPSSEKLWLLWGAASGLGLLNKPSMTFFLLALLFGLLLTPQRKMLASRWAAAGIALMFAIAVPYLVWQMHHQWATFEFLRDGEINHKNVSLAPIAFLVQQVVVLHPVGLLVWFAGLIYLLRNPAAKPFRWMGFTYLFFLAITMALHAKDYYVSPIYPMLFAAGGVTWERRYAAARAVTANRAYAFPVLETILLVTAALLLPVSIPVMRPEAFLAYSRALHLTRTTNSENDPSGELPQFYADRFGWQEEVDQITRISNGLSPEDRAKAVVLCTNYGEASAVDFLGHGLPPAISGHNNYFLWGTHGATGEVVIAPTLMSQKDLEENYEHVEIVGRMDTHYSMPFEHRNLYLLRGRKKNLTADWPDFKHYE